MGTLEILFVYNLSFFDIKSIFLSYMAHVIMFYDISKFQVKILKIKQDMDDLSC